MTRIVLLAVVLWSTEVTAADLGNPLDVRRIQGDGPALAEVNLCVGGIIRARYRGDGALGDAETIETTILAYEPPTMMATRISRVPASFPFPQA